MWSCFTFHIITFFLSWNTTTLPFKHLDTAGKHWKHQIYEQNICNREAKKNMWSDSKYAFIKCGYFKRLQNRFGVIWHFCCFLHNSMFLYVVLMPSLKKCNINSHENKRQTHGWPVYKIYIYKINKMCIKWVWPFRTFEIDIIWCFQKTTVNNPWRCQVSAFQSGRCIL